jgi:type I restriction enzyme S subunit
MRVDEWVDLALGEVLTLQRGFDLPARSRRPGPHPIVSSSGVTGFHSEFKVEAPGVVIGRYGSLGSVHWVTEPFWPLNTSLWVRDFKGNDERFVACLLRTVAVDSSTASAVPGVNRNHLHKLPVRLPSLTTQRRIAAVLSALGELIEINERRIELLEDLARSLYREWFVHFRFPGHGDVELVDSELGPIPEGWEVRTIDQIAAAVRGRSYRRAELSESGGVPFLNLKCLKRDGGFRQSGLKRYLGSYKDTQRAATGDILVAITDMTQERRIVAQAFRMPDLGELFAVPSLDLTLLKPKREGMRPFLYATLRYSGFSERLRQFANGANVLHLSVDRILEYSLAVPDAKLLQAFTTAITPILDGAEFLEVHNRQLAAIRDLLLPRLVTGRLDIADIDLGVLTPTAAE